MPAKNCPEAQPAPPPSALCQFAAATPPRLVALLAFVAVIAAAAFCAWLA